MTRSGLEHVNVTVTDPERTAKILCDILGWHIRWQGKSIHNGFTVHVGTNDSYVALYAPPDAQTAQTHGASYHMTGGINHIGIAVHDLDAVEQKVRAAGFAPFNHADYEPGRRFYFRDADDVEFEIVSYD